MLDTFITENAHIWSDQLQFEATSFISMLVRLVIGQLWKCFVKCVNC